MISHKHHFIFLRNPKTASTSIKDELIRYSEELRVPLPKNKYKKGFYLNVNRGKIKKDTPHLTIRDFFMYYPKINLNNYKKIIFVRNPWDLVVSLYSFYRTKYPSEKIYPEFNYFVRKYQHVLKEHIQVDRMKDMDGNIMIDFIGRFENLQGDFTKMCKELKLPPRKLQHCNPSMHDHYSKYYNKKTQEIVAEIFKEDIEYFGYKFSSK